MNELGMSWKIRVRFGGKSVVRQYTTPDVRSNDPGWGSEIFKQGIEMLEFFLPTGHRIVLAGMEQYNFFVEASQSLGGGPTKIEAFWFLGRLPGRPVTECIRVAEGSVVREHRPAGKEWGGGPTTGWKRGVVGGPVYYRLVCSHN